jgi:hypothetical protein
MAEIVDIRGKTIESPSTPTYFNYEIHLLPVEGQAEATVIKDYGFLIANGAFYAIGRGPSGAVELMAAANADQVNYVCSTGQYNHVGKFDS